MNFLKFYFNFSNQLIWPGGRKISSMTKETKRVLKEINNLH